MDFKKIALSSYVANYPVLLSIGFIIVSVLLKITFLTNPFFGFEYEDAFIYADASRFLLHNYDWSIDPFQTKICTDGSISNCYEYATFSGHYMVLPLIVSLFHRVLGYSVNNIFFVNFITSLATLVLFIKFLRRLNLPLSSVVLTTLIFVSTPFLNLFNTSGLAETLSSFFLLLSFYFFIKSYAENFSYKRVTFWLLILALLISYMIKRENLILILLPAIGGCLLFVSKKLDKHNLVSLSVLFLILLFTALIYNQLAGIHKMELRESKDIGASTFSLTNLEMIFPQFIHSFLKLKYFGVTGVLFLATTLYTLFYVKRFEFRLVMIFSWLYLILYSAHYRSYSQVHFGQITMFETLRYSTNFLPLACLSFATINVQSHIVDKSIVRKATVICCAILFLIVMVFSNFNLRKKMSQDEFAERISPVMETLRLTSQSDYLLTETPAIFHIYSTDERTIIGINSTNERRILNLIASTENGHVFLLMRKEEEFKLGRTLLPFIKSANLQVLKISNISQSYELLKFTN